MSNTRRNQQHHGDESAILSLAAGDALCHIFTTPLTAPRTLLLLPDGGLPDAISCEEADAFFIVRNAPPTPPTYSSRRTIPVLTLDSMGVCRAGMVEDLGQPDAPPEEIPLRVVISHPTQHEFELARIANGSWAVFSLLRGNWTLWASGSIGAEPTGPLTPWPDRQGSEEPLPQATLSEEDRRAVQWQNF